MAPRRQPAAKPAASASTVSTLERGDGPALVRAKDIDGEHRVVGFYDNKRIRGGQEFTIRSRKNDFSSKWMELVEADDRRPSERAAASKKVDESSDDDSPI